jgi:hypothetical protein
MTVTVEAGTPDEALEVVKRNYNDCDYILDAESFVGVEFKLKNEERTDA